MKLIKISILSVVVLILGYFSMEITPLDAIKKDTQVFNAVDYAQHFVNVDLPSVYNRAVPLHELLNTFKTDVESAFDKWSNSIAVGNIGHFLIQTSGIVIEILEDEIIMETPSGTIVRLQTEFIYGNTIRDASGLVDNKEFPNTADLNAIAAEINNIIRTERIPSFRNDIQVGDTLNFIGALEINQKFPTTDDIEILPIQTIEP